MNVGIAHSCESSIVGTVLRVQVNCNSHLTLDCDEKMYALSLYCILKSINNLSIYECQHSTLLSQVVRVPLWGLSSEFKLTVTLI